MTFSIVARCSETGRFGVAISSSSPAVAARCAHVRAGVGAIATQNITDPRLGPQGLDLLAKGLGAVEVVEALRQTAPYADYRQILAIDRAGITAEFSGAHALGVHASLAGRDCLAAGNLLAGPQVILAVIAGFEHDAHADLGDRLIAAMQAGLAAGGEAGPLHSAGLLIADQEAWPIADLRVDWTDGDPISELTSLWQLWKPQMHAYVTRALDPREAPSYGVPGNL